MGKGDTKEKAQEAIVIFQDTKMEKTSPLVALGTLNAIESHVKPYSATHMDFYESHG